MRSLPFTRSQQRQRDVERHMCYKTRILSEELVGPVDASRKRQRASNHTSRLPKRRGKDSELALPAIQLPPPHVLRPRQVPAAPGPNNHQDSSPKGDGERGYQHGLPVECPRLNERAHDGLSERLASSGQEKSLPKLTEDALRQLQRELRGPSSAVEEEIIMPPPTKSGVGIPKSASGSTQASKITLDTANDAFEGHLRLCRVVDATGSSNTPRNLPELRKMLKSRRRSGPSSETEIAQYRHRVRESGNEATLVHTALQDIVPTRYIGISATLKPVHEKSWTKAKLSCPDPSQETGRPKPDYSVGFHATLFSRSALIALGDCAIVGGNKVAWPVLTLEAKSTRGNLVAAWLQNQHNGSVAVSNLLRMKQRIGKEDEFLGVAHVLSINFNGDALQLSCHWATRDTDGLPTYHGAILASWFVTDTASGKPFVDARKSVLNAVEWLETTVFEQIKRDVDLYGSMLKQAAPSLLSSPRKPGTPSESTLAETDN